MKIQLKTEIKGIAFELSVSEALTLLNDPKRIQDEIRVMLKAGGIEVPNNPAKKSEATLEMIRCPDCGKEVKKRGLKIHQTRGCPARKKE